MKPLKICYGALAIVAATVLAVSLFMQDVKPLTQLSLLIQSVGFGWMCGFTIGADM